MDHHDGLLAIGTFSRLTSISVRMLRHYQEHELLSPAHVDPHSGRRFYSADQLRTANLIVSLRDAGFPIDAIARTLSAGADPVKLDDELEQHHRRLAERSRELYAQLAQFDRLRTLLKGHPDMTDVTIEHMPSMVLAGLRRVVSDYSEETRLWNEIMGLLRESDAAFPAGGWSGATFHDPTFKENDADIEVWVQVTGPFTPPDGLEFRQVEECDVVTAALHGDYAQVPAVTEQIGRFLAARDLTVGPMFNIYHVSPAQNPDPTAWVTQLCFPIIEGEDPRQLEQ
jgi:DNA-binding transcriptional MerR regulator